MTNQLDLLAWSPPKPYEALGNTFQQERDGKRLGEQAQRVARCMADGQRRTLRAIAIETGAPEASASARLRDLRRHGFTVERAYLGAGLWEYWVTK